jgi:putative ABC transport system substrate-binding protein
MARMNWRAGALTLLLLAGAATAHAQTQGARTPLLAILSLAAASPEPSGETAFCQALRELGWIEGQNLRVEIRDAEWKEERLEPLAAELIRLNPDVLWTHGRYSFPALRRLATTVPVVLGAATGIVESGLARSLARPGGNVTGMEVLGIDLEPKRVEVLRDALPRFRRIGILAYTERTDPRIRSVEEAAATLRLEVAYARAVAPPEIEGAIAALARDRAQAVLVVDGPIFALEPARVATSALRHRLPTISQVPGFAEAGGLLQYGVDILDVFRRSASYVDRILRGAKPGDLPIEQPAKITPDREPQDRQGAWVEDPAVPGDSGGSGHSVMDRRTFLGVLALLSAPLAAGAQPAGKAYRIGVLSTQSPSPRYREAFQQGLRDLGRVEGKNLTVEYRSAEGRADRLPGLAAELIHLDLIFAIGPAAVRAAKSATGKIPIVAIDLESDPVEAGFVASRARPGGNITGIFLDQPELSGKWLQFLREAAPQMSTVAVLWDSANPTPAQLNAIEGAARVLGVRLQAIEVRGPGDFEIAFRAATKSRAGGGVLLSSPIFSIGSARLADLAAKSRLPTISPFKEFAAEGGLMAYGPNLIDLFRRSAALIDVILKGAKPAETPVQRLATFDLVINMKTAKTLGLTIPQSLLLRADQVIQ